MLEEEERRVSEEYIQRLLAEEEELLQEDKRRREEDERLARQLSSQLNSAPISEENVGSADVAPVKKKKKKKEVSAGQMERFLCPLPSSSSSDCSFRSNKENILLSQVKLQVERPLPNLDYYRSEPPSASVEVQLHLRSHLIGDGGPSSAKRRCSELEATDDEEVVFTKQGCLSLPSSSSLEVEVGGSALQGIAEWEAELLNRQQQEEEDRRMALLLQKELDQEERQRATDRRKGSSDPYLLRQNRRRKVEAGSSGRPSRKTSTTSSPTSVIPSKTTSSPTSVKTTKTSTSSSPSSRGSKQATLTEMFSSLSS